MNIKLVSIQIHFVHFVTGFGEICSKPSPSRWISESKFFYSLQGPGENCEKWWHPTVTDVFMNKDYPFSFQGRPICNMTNIFTTLGSVVNIFVMIQITLPWYKGKVTWNLTIDK